MAPHPRRDAPPAPLEAQPGLARRLFPRGLAAFLPEEGARLLVLAAAVGALGALGAAGFRVALHGALRLFFGAPENILAAAEHVSAWRRVLMPGAGALVGALLAIAVRRIPGAGGGVAGIMEAVSIRRGAVGLAAAIGRAGCSLATLGSGGSVGREGPIIQLAASIGSRLGRAVDLPEARLRVLVACGAASGFAAAYNTPMAAALFVVEVLVGAWSADVLGPAAVASVVSTAVTQLLHGKESLYRITPFELVSPAELVPYALLGLLAAAVGTAFLATLEGAERLFARALRSPVLRAAAGGLLVGALAVRLPEVLGNGYETTSEILTRGFAARWLLLVLVAKLAATAATVGSGGPGGVFTPTLLLGAALGGAVGDALQRVHPGGTGSPGAYALVGMGALLAATTHAPLLAVVFVYEVSQDYPIILPLMLACFVASAFARRWRPRSIYEEELEKRGVSWEGRPEARALRAMRVRDLVAPAALLPRGTPGAEIEKALADPRADAVYVGDAEGRLVGAIDIHGARRLLRDVGAAAVTAGDLATSVPVLAPDATAVEASEALLRADREELPVVEPATGRFLGLASRRRLLGAIDEEILHREFFVDARAADDPAGRHLVELPRGFRIEELRVPPSLAGKALAEADLERRCGLAVLAVVRRRADGSEERCPPAPALRLARGESLVLYGAAADLERLRASE
jgi:CIC family chloride channel protein